MSPSCAIVTDITKCRVITGGLGCLARCKGHTLCGLDGESILRDSDRHYVKSPPADSGHRAPDTGLFKAPGANHPNASQLRAGRGGLATQGTREPKRKTKPPRSTAKPGPGAGNKLCARQSDQQRLLLRMLASACTAASRRRRPSRRCQQWHPARAPAASRAPAKRPAAPAAPSGRSTQASATRRAPPSRKRRPSRRCQQRPAQGAGSQPRARQSDQQRACCSDLATQASASRRAAVHRRVENEDELPLSTEAPGPGAGSQPPVKATSTSSSISKH